MGADDFHPTTPRSERPLPPRPLSNTTPKELLQPLRPDPNSIPVDHEPYPFTHAKTPPVKHGQRFPAYRTDSREKVNVFPSHDSPIAFSANRPVAVTCAPCVSTANPQFYPPITSMAHRVNASLLSGHSSRSHSLPRPNANGGTPKTAVPYSPALSRNPESDPHFKRSIEKFRRSPHAQRNEVTERFHRASIGASIDTRRYPRHFLGDPQSNSPELSNRLIAIFDYNARTDEEISLRKGDSMLALNDT